MPKAIDFFDVDHTIIRGSSARHFAMAGVREHVFPLRALFFIPFYYLSYRYGTISVESFERLFPLFRGMARDRLEAISRSSFEQRLKQSIYNDAVVLMSRLKDAGRMVVFATSSLDVIVQPLADYLGIEAVIATSLEFAEEPGLCTGNFAAPPIFGFEKKKRVMDFIRTHGSRPESCSFYTDSIHDLALLEAIGNPVAVNPDPRLKRVARRNGWRVVGLCR